MSLFLMFAVQVIFNILFQRLIHDVDVNQFFVLSSVSQSRGHLYKLYKSYSSGVRSSFFSETVIIYGTVYQLTWILVL